MSLWNWPPSLSHPFQTLFSHCLSRVTLIGGELLIWKTITKSINAVTKMIIFLLFTFQPYKNKKIWEKKLIDDMGQWKMMIALLILFLNILRSAWVKLTNFTETHQQWLTTNNNSIKHQQPKNRKIKPSNQPRF